MRRVLMPLLGAVLIGSGLTARADELLTLTTGANTVTIPVASSRGTMNGTPAFPLAPFTLSNNGGSFGATPAGTGFLLTLGGTAPYTGRVPRSIFTVDVANSAVTFVQGSYSLTDGSELSITALDGGKDLLTVSETTGARNVITVTVPQTLVANLFNTAVTAVGISEVPYSVSNAVGNVSAVSNGAHGDELLVIDSDFFFFDGFTPAHLFTYTPPAYVRYASFVPGTYTFDDGSGLQVTTVTPEPSTFMLLGSGALMLGSLLRRRDRLRRI